MKTITLPKIPIPGALVSVLGLLTACDAATVPTEEPMALAVTPLTGTSCGDPDAPTPNPDPFVDAPNVTVAVRALDDETGLWDTLVKKGSNLRAGEPLVLSKVPEGPDREVILFAQGGQHAWYGRDTGLDIRRNADNTAAMLLTRFGGLSCVPTPLGIQNTVFPAVVTLGDGRVLVTGGFSDLASDAAGARLTGASNQAFLFDPRTGAAEVLPGLGANQGRAGHAAVYLEATDKVVLLGGMTELQIDQGRPFPYVYEAARGRDDYVIFDVATKTFTPGTERMRAKRGFPRAAALADGTVLVTGGGTWPFDPAGTDQIQADIFDPEANDGAGGLLDIPPLRSFYWRAGHSLTFLGNSPEGLTTLLIWGGTTLERSLGHPAEIYRQSGRQREGVNGTFTEVALTGETPPFTYFHETTRLSGGRFLVTGGARHAGGQLQAPEADEAWLLTYNSDPAPVLQTRRIAGLGPGRVFHSALSSDLATVSVLGGWGPVEAVPGALMTFDLATQSWRTESAAAALAGRGGHGATLTPAGSILLIGGESSSRVAAGQKRMAAEIYTPASLPVP